MTELNLNDEKFVNSIVYYGMEYCFNSECARKASCFRFIAAKFKDPNKKRGNAIFPDALKDGKCAFHLQPRIIQAAWGLSHLYDEVRHEDIAAMRRKATTLLGGKTSYYRYHRGEKKLSPEMQQSVYNLFEKNGYSKPTFDHFKEEIAFKKDSND